MTTKANIKILKNFPPHPSLPNYPSQCISDRCAICEFPVNESDKAIECDKCLLWVHIKCNKISNKQYKNWDCNVNFECKKCNSCNICDKLVGKKHNAIECDVCNRWIHIKCNKFDKKEYELYKNDSSRSFYCIDCLSDALPLNNTTDNEFKLILQGIKCPDVIEIDSLFLSSYEIEKTRQLNEAIENFDNFEDDESGPCSNKCKYFSQDEFRDLKIDENKNFSVLHLNIHSVEAHIDEFRTTLKMINFMFDIICISESKIRYNINPKSDINIDGYQSPESMPSHASKGGVLIYARKGINYVPRADLAIQKEKELESLFVEIINTKGKNEIIGVIYRHPCMDKSIFTQNYMQPLIEKLNKENKNIYLAGDFNFDFLSLNDQENNAFFETMMSHHLLPTITIPTKINPVKNTVIDNIFINNINSDIIAGNFSLTVSDHLPSFLITPKLNQYHAPKKHNIFKRCTKNFNKDSFLSDLNQINWKDLLESEKNDVNASMLNFINKMNNLLDKHLPLRRVTQKEFKRRYKPWINDDLLHKISRKSTLYKKIMKAKSSEQKEILQLEFKTLKNQITNQTRHSKQNYYKNYFTSCANDLRKIWKGIKEIINVKSKNSDVPSCVKEKGKIITETKNITNSFNRYYTSIADDILKERKYTGSKSYHSYLTDPSSKTFMIFECDPVEIQDIISNFKSNKGSGPNSIPSFILKNFKKELSVPLSILFNMSFKTGVHPDILKIAKTIPIFKKGSKLEIGNYRPISLLSNLNKIIEKLMFNRVYSFIEKHNLLYKLQFGFRRKHSTNHALIEITELIRSALDSKRYACGIFIDLQKAFDTVNHDILVKKLAYYGIRGVGNTWFQSYLTERSQYVSILGYNSEKNSVKHGVPQGSVLGPLLFLLYINDLHKAVSNCNVFHFADDTNLLNISDSPKQMQKQINYDLKMVYQWLLANKISLNNSKTELVIFGKKQSLVRNFAFKIKMNGKKIFPSDHIKYLGVYLDSTLSGNSHTEILSTKLRRANGMLSKIRHYVSHKELLSIYHAIFSSHMSYGCQIWGQGFDKYINKVAVLQNNAMRLINFKNWQDSATPLYKKNHLLKVKDTIQLNNCMFLYDSIKGSLPVCFNNKYHTLQNTYKHFSTKSSTLGCFFRPVVNTTQYGLNSIMQRSIHSWNTTSKELNIDLSTLSRKNLKKTLTEHFLNKYN